MMSILEQYGLLLALVLGIAATVLALSGIARAMGPTRREPGKDVPASSGVLSRDPVWGRYHARYYGYALLFLPRHGNGIYVPLGSCIQGSRAGCFV